MTTYIAPTNGLQRGYRIVLVLAGGGALTKFERITAATLSRCCLSARDVAGKSVRRLPNRWAGWSGLWQSPCQLTPGNSCCPVPPRCQARPRGFAAVQ